MMSLVISFSRAVYGLLIALLCVLSFAAPGSSMAGGNPPNPKDLTQGKWELQSDKSKFCNPAQAPQKSGREIADEGWGLISVLQTGVNAKGDPTNGHYVYRYDGQKYPATIYGTRQSTEAITWKLVSPSRVEFEHWSKDNKITEKYVRTVSSDGQTMTQTGKRTGQTCEEAQVFLRQ
jgi:hypothetical protein